MGTVQRHLRMERLAEVPTLPASPPPAFADLKAVDHPPHYGGKENVYEHVKVAKAWRLGPFLYQCTKYICRAGKKDPAKYIEELEKAKWFLQEEINSQYDLMLKGGRP